MSTVQERNEAWRTYQQKLSNLTELQEAQIERAFTAGWLARSKLIEVGKREVEQ
jgi:hypothetical protein